MDLVVTEFHELKGRKEWQKRFDEAFAQRIHRPIALCHLSPSPMHMYIHIHIYIYICIYVYVK